MWNKPATDFVWRICRLFQLHSGTVDSDRAQSFRLVLKQGGSRGFCRHHTMVTERFESDALHLPFTPHSPTQRRVSPTALPVTWDYRFDGHRRLWRECVTCGNNKHWGLCLLGKKYVALYGEGQFNLLVFKSWILSQYCREIWSRQRNVRNLICEINIWVALCPLYLVYFTYSGRLINLDYTVGCYQLIRL